MDIIKSLAEPTEAEVEAGEAVTFKDDPDATPIPKGSVDPNAEVAPGGIPDFWLTALKNHIAFSSLITERDEAALQRLTDITLEYLDGEYQGYRITFHFSSNDFFEDATLTKEYRYKDELDIEGDYLYERAVGSTIHWKEDKDLTQEIEVKRQRNKGKYHLNSLVGTPFSLIVPSATNRTRVVRRAKPTDSFFNFFSPPEPPTEEAEADMDGEELEEIEESLEMDYQLGQDLKDRVRTDNLFSIHSYPIPMLICYNSFPLRERSSLVRSTISLARPSNGKMRMRTTMKMRTILMRTMMKTRMKTMKMRMMTFQLVAALLLRVVRIMSILKNASSNS